MDFSEYEKIVDETAIYPNRGNNITYPTLGLCGEAGEVAEKVKKLMRDNNGEVDDEFVYVVSKELGDVLWYVAAICKEVGVTMNEIAALNILKLRSRKERNVVGGSGDNR